MIVLGILAVWFCWQVLEHWLFADRWVWCLIVGVLGVGWQCLEDWDLWWHGLGIGGGALLLALVADLLLLVTDWVKVQVLRKGRG